MSIPSIDQLSGAFNTICHNVTYAFGFIPPVYRAISSGLKLQKIYEDPNMSTTRKTAAILLTGINMTAESQLVARKINHSPNEELQQLASAAIISRAGTDLLNMLDKESYANIWETATSRVKPTIKSAKYVFKIQQIAHNRDDLNTYLSVLESTEILYTYREAFKEAFFPKLKQLYRTAIQASQTAVNAFPIQQPTISRQQKATQTDDPLETTTDQLMQILFHCLLVSKGKKNAMTSKPQDH